MVLGRRVFSLKDSRTYAFSSECYCIWHSPNSSHFQFNKCSVCALWEQQNNKKSYMIWWSIIFEIVNYVRIYGSFFVVVVVAVVKSNLKDRFGEIDELNDRAMRLQRLQSRPLHTDSLFELAKHIWKLNERRWSAQSITLECVTSVWKCSLLIKFMEKYKNSLNAEGRARFNCTFSPISTWKEW